MKWDEIQTCKGTCDFKTHFTDSPPEYCPNDCVQEDEHKGLCFCQKHNFLGRDD